MKRKVENEMEDELRSEYNFAQMQGGIRGKYVERYRLSTVLEGEGRRIRYSVTAFTIFSAKLSTAVFKT
jgi:hypothetical protein